MSLIVAINWGVHCACMVVFVMHKYMSVSFQLFKAGCTLLMLEFKVVKSAYEPNWLIRPEPIPVSVTLSD